MNKNFIHSTFEEYQRDEIFKDSLRWFDLTKDCYVPDCKRLIFRLYLYHRLTNDVTNKISTLFFSHFDFLILLLLFSVCNSYRNVLSTVKIGHSSISMYISKKKERKEIKKKEKKEQPVASQNNSLIALYVDNIKESSKKQKVNYCKKRRSRPSSEALISSGITSNNE